jgi:hypothetical protein
MHYVIEAILVGIYVGILYSILSTFISNTYTLLLVCGFLKHTISYYFNLLTWYCNNGYACFKNNNLVVNNLFIFDFLIEAFLFLLVGSLLNLVMKQSIVMFMFIGFMLHIFFEIIGIHQWFCKHKCKKK